MKPERIAALVFAFALAAAAPAARAFQPGSVLFVEPFVGIRQWIPGSQTSSIVISGPPLSDPRGVAVDHAGNVIVTDRLAGNFRYSPTGAFDTNMGGIGGVDVTVGPSGSVYVVTESGDVYNLNPPYLTFIAGSIPDPRGIVSSFDQFGNDLLVVTSGANGGELFRVQYGSTTVIATNLGDVGRPGVDRFGNVLVARTGRVYVLDPNTGAQRGSFTSSTILDPQDVTATSGDRYFIADGDNGGDCRIVEIDPIAGGATLAAPITIGENTPWSIATVPGGTSSPTLATGDIVLSDTGAFGGAGGIFRVNPTSGAVRALRLGGSRVALDMLRVGPTHELIAAGPSAPDVNRIDPGTGRATVIADASQIGGVVQGAQFDRNGDLLLAVEDNPVPSWDGRILRVERALEPSYFNVVQVAALAAEPKAFLFPYRAAPGGPFAGIAFMAAVLEVNVVLPSWMVFDLTTGVVTDIGETLDLVYQDNSALTADGRVLYYTNGFSPYVERVDDWPTGALPTTLTYHGLLTKVMGIDVDASGSVLVADADAFGGGGGIIRVDPTTGAQTRVTTTTFVDPDGIAVVPPPSCSDGVDNDGDGLVDYPHDPGCSSFNDPWETTDCNDGIDNDGDGLIDWDPNGDGPDTSCKSALAGIEQTQCSDGADNDGDGKIDGADPQCTNPAVNKESGSACGLLGIEVVGVAGWAIGRTAQHRRRQRT